MEKTDPQAALWCLITLTGPSVPRIEFSGEFLLELASGGNVALVKGLLMRDGRHEGQVRNGAAPCGQSRTFGRCEGTGGDAEFREGARSGAGGSGVGS